MRTLCLIPIAALLAACTSMQPVPPQTYLESNNPEHVRIYSAAGTMTVIDAPRLQGTILSGFDRIEREETRIDLSQIRRMEAKTIDKQRTAFFVGGMSILAGVGAYMLGRAGDGDGLICDGYEFGKRCVERQPSKPRIPLGVQLRF